MEKWDKNVLKNDITPVINHAKKICKNDDWLAFIKETIETDRYRKESFEQTFPNYLSY